MDLEYTLATAALAGQSKLRRLAKWMVENRAAVGGMTITDLAAAAGVGETTVFRLCRTLGFSGYRELRIALAERRGATQGNKLLPLDVPLDSPEWENLGQIVRRIIEVHVETLHDTLRLADPVVLERATAQLLRAQHIYLLGFGSSSPIAADASQRLVRLGLVASAHSDPHVLATLAANPPPHSLFFAISFSGQTRDVVETLEAAGRRGCPRILLTSNPGSAATQYAETVLISAVRRSPLEQQEWVATRVSQLALIDMLCVCIALRHPRRADFVHEGVLFERELSKKFLPEAALGNGTVRSFVEAGEAKGGRRSERSSGIGPAAANWDDRGAVRETKGRV